ncbi:testis-specific Y-encoded protein 4-like [Fukomys damarensis]|uniref:testis-specific Y-encoded protein 4-like n=1 Tax=Fukomys damarensis TaxID=885580 RepID=UPI00053F66D0|nr:testis-specific Y-encoded protein 4-like [Fukomys damarensis]
MAERGRRGRGRAPREPVHPPGLRARVHKAEAPRAQTPRACGAGESAVQSEARASPREPSGSGEEARLREGETLLGPAGMRLVGEGRGAKKPAEREKRAKGKPGGLRQPRQEKQEEKQPAQAALSAEAASEAAGDPPSALPPVEQLRALRLDPQPVTIQARKDFGSLGKKERHRRKAHLKRRSLLIQDIPGFWATAVSVCAEPLGGT